MSDPEGDHDRRLSEVAPELVFEVLSPDDRWPKVLAKVAEYLEAGVLSSAWSTRRTNTVHLYRPESRPRSSGRRRLVRPRVLGDFRVPVRRFFE